MILCGPCRREVRRGRIRRRASPSTPATSLEPGCRRRGSRHSPLFWRFSITARSLLSVSLTAGQYPLASRPTPHAARSAVDAARRAGYSTPQPEVEERAAGLLLAVDQP